MFSITAVWLLDSGGDQREKKPTAAGLGANDALSVSVVPHKVRVRDLDGLFTESEIDGTGLVLDTAVHDVVVRRRIETSSGEARSDGGVHILGEVAKGSTAVEDDGQRGRRGRGAAESDRVQIDPVSAGQVSMGGKREEGGGEGEVHTCSFHPGKKWRE